MSNDEHVGTAEEWDEERERERRYLQQVEESEYFQEMDDSLAKARLRQAIHHIVCDAPSLPPWMVPENDTPEDTGGQTT